MTEHFDLNAIVPPIDELGGPSTRWNTARMRHTRNAGTSVVVGDLSVAATKFVQRAELLVGCISYLTAHEIIDAMSSCDGVSIVIQKQRIRKSDLRRRYNRLKFGPPRSLYPFPLGNCAGGRDEIPPIRCMGDTEGGAGMHHKFVVRCELEDGRPVPVKAWIGSYNFSWQGTRSTESAVILQDSVQAAGLFDEYLRIASLSESLDWTSEAFSPEWRILD